ncbi:hypothetical protein [Streptomyces sp. SM12]|uniref:hypothetical protein n=1 Tax=Streptomyces sp. SM12 TaxID=1071602 RepID=UPI000CD527D4|nr:hypothetical protein [Streptomyces sp. SM12]
MSTTTAKPTTGDEDQDDGGVYIAPTGGLVAILATILALAGAALALAGLFANGLWPTIGHITLVLVVFAILRATLVWALTGTAPIDLHDPDDDPR